MGSEMCIRDRLYEPREGDENRRILYVESIGFLPPRRILLEAAKALEKKASELEEKFSEELSKASS